jgi:hypothetical protein
MEAMLEAAKGLGRYAVIVILPIAVSGALAPSARALTLRLSTPAPSLTDTPCRVMVAVSRPVRKATALLQEGHGRRWQTVSRKRLLRRSVTLSCPVARAPRTRRFRALVRRGRRILARSTVLSVHVRPAPPAPPAATPPGTSPPLAPPASPPPRSPLDPAQFGAEGTGGPPSPETLALVGNPNVVFDATGVSDLQAGRIDPRVVAVLGSLAQGHVLTVSGLCTGYPRLTAGGTVSTHYLGRGVDIARIDGVPVNAGNATARDVTFALASLDPAYRPDEVGTPFSLSLPGYFTDATTQNLLHIAFTQPIDPSWSPP